MWNNLDIPWKEAFELAWESYKKGTIPIGCVIVSKEGKIISKGRNQIFDTPSESPLAGTNMAHAEMNALLGLKETEHPDIREYILYTTMEPCPMCFGTIVMMNIRSICFGARDGFAGATSLSNKLDYINNKSITISQGTEEIEAFQLILQSEFEYQRKHPKVEMILNVFRNTNNAAIECGYKLYKEGYFPQAIRRNISIEQVYNEVIKYYSEFKSSEATL